MKAKNRKEIFLKALANGEEPNIKPLTREEILLKKQAERESAGGGGGASSGGGAFVVEVGVDMNGGTPTFKANKTYGEIVEKIKSGIKPTVMLAVSADIIPMFYDYNGSSGDNSLIFNRYSTSDGMFIEEEVKIRYDDVVKITSIEIVTIAK